MEWWMFETWCEQLLRDAKEPTIILDEKCRILFANASAGTLLGLPSELLPGRWIDALLHVWPRWTWRELLEESQRSHTQGLRSVPVEAWCEARRDTVSDLLLELELREAPDARKVVCLTILPEGHSGTRECVTPAPPASHSMEH